MSSQNVDDSWRETTDGLLGRIASILENGRASAARPVVVIRRLPRGNRRRTGWGRT